MKLKLNALLLTLTVATVAFAGCNEAPEVKEDAIPGTISEEQVAELESRASELYPRTVKFPNQVEGIVEPIRDVFEGRLDPGQGFGVEWPNDNGQLALQGDIVPFDLATVADIPDYQPVEIRLKLKWWGDPGSSVDMDIYVDVPGTNDGYDGTSDDESWNWNIVTKFRVVNTVKLPGEPLVVGMHLQNAKNMHPDGVKYELHWEVFFPPNVLAPLVAYEISVPDDANILIFESEPVTGDEHVTSQIVLVDPQDNVVIDRWHNDIATETYSVPVRGGGEYVLYAKYMHGGFLRVETDVQNEGFEARALTTTITEEVVGGNAGPGTTAPSGYAVTGSLPEGTILDARAFIRATQAAAPQGTITMAVINDNGDYHVVSAAGQVNGEAGRVGNDYENSYDPENPNSPTIAGPFRWGYTNNAAVGIEGGYWYVTYTR